MSGQLKGCGNEGTQQMSEGVNAPLYKNMRVFLFICVFLFFACSYF